MRLIFISHVFPDGNDAWRGLENVALLQSLSDRWEVRALILRSVGPWPRRHAWHSRAADVAFRPEFVPVPTMGFLGKRWHARQAARALRRPLALLRRDWRFDAVLCGSLFPSACAASRLAVEFQFRFVALSVQDESARRISGAGTRGLVAASLARSAGVVTDSQELSALLSQSRFRKERVTLISGADSASEACHRLLLPVRG